MCQGSQWSSPRRTSYTRVPTTRYIFLARIPFLSYIFLGNISFFSLHVLAFLAGYALFLVSCICGYGYIWMRRGEFKRSEEREEDIPFSERKGLANRKCLSVCLSNQSECSISEKARACSFSVEN